MLERNPTASKFLDRKEWHLGNFIVCVMVSITSFTPREWEQTSSMPIPLWMNSRSCCGIMASAVVRLPSLYIVLYFTISGSAFPVKYMQFPVKSTKLLLSEIYPIHVTGCRCLWKYGFPWYKLSLNTAGTENDRFHCSSNSSRLVFSRLLLCSSSSIMYV